MWGFYGAGTIYINWNVLHPGNLFYFILHFIFIYTLIASLNTVMFTIPLAHELAKTNPNESNSGRADKIVKMMVAIIGFHELAHMMFRKVMI